MVRSGTPVGVVSINLPRPLPGTFGVYLGVLRTTAQNPH